MQRSAHPLGFGEDPLFAQVNAPMGSEAWAEYLRGKLQKAVDLEIRGVIEFTSESRLFMDHDGWRALRDASGHPFQSWRGFCLAKRPEGLGCAPDAFQRVTQLLKQTPADVVAEAVVAAPVGAPKGNVNARKATGAIKGDNITIVPQPRPAERGTSASYLARRLKRDAPEIAARAEAGEFKSMRAAGIAAGIVKPKDPIKATARAIGRVPLASHGEVARALAALGVEAIWTAINALPRKDQETVRDRLVNQLRMA